MDISKYGISKLESKKTQFFFSFCKINNKKICHLSHSSVNALYILYNFLSLVILNKKKIYFRNAEID